MVSTIGVLALQGDVSEHARAIESLGSRALAIKYARQLDHVDGLIIPGGESTTIAKLTRESNDSIFDTILSRIDRGMPVYGTCMGSIFLARAIEGSTQGKLAVMDIKVRRNAFGPQRFSFETEVDIPALGDEPFPAVFIRGPVILSCSEKVEVMATVGSDVGNVRKLSAAAKSRSALSVEMLDETPERYIVMARQGNLLASSFHPELTDDLRVHSYFLQMVKNAEKGPVSAVVQHPGALVGA